MTLCPFESKRGEGKGSEVPNKCFSKPTETRVRIVQGEFPTPLPWQSSPQCQRNLLESHRANIHVRHHCSIPVSQYGFKSLCPGDSVSHQPFRAPSSSAGMRTDECWKCRRVAVKQRPLPKPLILCLEKNI